MRTQLVAALSVFFAAISAVVTAGEVQSGLEAGGYPTPFIVQDCTGPSKGERLCYYCKYGVRPVVSVFARELDSNLPELLKKVDQLVKQRRDREMRAFFVLLTDDPDRFRPRLIELAEKHKIELVPLTIFDGPQGPPKYELREEAALTVMMWKDGRIEANHALADGELDEKAIDTIVRSAKATL